MVSKPIQEYPVNGLMPKQDTQAASFIKKYSNYDGRGTVIAIMDTGVDPGAAGMQVTTDGKPKVIDIVDCTGGGDVDTSKIVKATSENGKQVVEGLSGRKLTLGNWNCPSGEYRVGLKRAYELFPSDLKSRIKAERRSNFVKKHAQLLTEAQSRLAEYNKKEKSLQEDHEKADLEARVEELKEMDKKYEDPGVILDCVVFHDGKDWRAVVDVNEDGDLSEQPCLTDYRKELKYHTFGKADLLNFSVNIYDNGNILSIVTLAGSHGTHVAGITAANFPDEPALNGVAPGAQLVSLRIGDARLGSMETGPGLTRAAAHLAHNKVDLANMSYGESSGLPTDGHFIKLMANEAIGKAGCIFVTSAGNDGPCYSSIGAPAGMDDSFITVGAYVKHSQMQAEYALLESVTERPFTWSSRGPSTDGYRGVDIYAPGSAITSIPVYVLNKLDLKNGTSMSSPNACGCIALLVSALKAEKIDYTPYRLKNAVVQTGASVDDPLGVGFIQVDKAWEYLESNKEAKYQDLLFRTTVLRNGTMRGIYLRELDETSQIQFCTAKVSPSFMNEEDPEDPKYNQAKFDYDARVALVTTQSWISAPDYLYLHSSGNAFQVKVDPTHLSVSKFHYGEVLGYDTTAPERGPLFRVPVSVVKPTPVPQGTITFDTVEYGPGDIVRRFVHVPEGATYCNLVLKSRAPIETSPARFMLHLLQVVPKKSQKNKHAYSFMLGDGSSGDPESNDQVIKKTFSVRGGLNLEVCLAQFWSGLGKHQIDLSLDFHGVQIAGNLANGESVLHLEPQVTRLDISAPVRREEKVNVNVSFNKIRKYIRPSEAVIAPLDAQRDLLPSTRVLYGLTLTYKFKIESSTTINARFPTVMNQLYEHFLAGVFGIVYDTNNKVVEYLDVFDHNIQIDQKGDYTIMLQLSTEEDGVLEKLRETICELDVDLKNTTFNTYNKIADVYSANSSTFSKVSLERKLPKAFYIAAPQGKDALAKEAKPGDTLVGKLNFTANVEGGQYRVLYNVPPAVIEPKKEKDSKNKKSSDEELAQQLKDSVRDAQLSHLKKLESSSSAYTDLLSKLEKDYPNDPIVLEARISAIWTASGNATINSLDNLSKVTEAQANDIIKLSDTVLSQYNLSELFEFYGRKKSNDESDEQKEKRKENDEKKKRIVSALRNKVYAYTILLNKESGRKELDEAIEALGHWHSDDSSTSLGSLLVKVKRETESERPGTALKAVQKYLSEVSLTADNAKDVAQAWATRADLYKKLGWDLWADYDKKWSLIRQPPYGAALF
ncbi:hypothetical protein K501DRAFT_247452 [Backusella circina FSU 941]|nr:hypothetical protein K501DRAFT_247452 [Backusella circina FSU 941]